MLAILLIIIIKDHFEIYELCKSSRTTMHKIAQNVLEIKLIKAQYGHHHVQQHRILPTVYSISLVLSSCKNCFTFYLFCVQVDYVLCHFPLSFGLGK